MSPHALFSHHNLVFLCNSISARYPPPLTKVNVIDYELSTRAVYNQPIKTILANQCKQRNEQKLEEQYEVFHYMGL